VPLIVVDPRLPADRRGSTNDELVLNADTAPTALAAAGLPAPRGMQGRDFAPLYLAKDPPPWRDEFYYEHAVVIGQDRIPAVEALRLPHGPMFAGNHPSLSALVNPPARPIMTTRTIRRGVGPEFAKDVIEIVDFHDSAS